MKQPWWIATVVVLSSMVLTTAARSGEPAISNARRDENGYLVHSVRSEFQAGTTKIRVLAPDRLEDGKKHRVLYVLPVEARDGLRWGDALEEIRNHDLHNRYRLICVYPTFSHLPWYADHPTDPKVRQESYFVQVVLPCVERTYPVGRGRESRLLVGFSKSGWGAFSLLLRHPDLFGKAVAWDAPLDMEKPNRFGMEGIFATQENFELYQVSALLEAQADKIRDAPRLIHLGYGNFRDHHLAVETRMNELRIPHVFHDGPKRTHGWNSGWLPDAIQLLAE